MDKVENVFRLSWDHLERFYGMTVQEGESTACFVVNVE